MSSSVPASSGTGQSSAVSSSAPASSGTGQSSAVSSSVPASSGTSQSSSVSNSTVPASYSAQSSSGFVASTKVRPISKKQTKTQGLDIELNMSSLYKNSKLKGKDVEINIPVDSSKYSNLKDQTIVISLPDKKQSGKGSKTDKHQIVKRMTNANKYKSAQKQSKLQDLNVAFDMGSSLYKDSKLMDKQLQMTIPVNASSLDKYSNLKEQTIEVSVPPDKDNQNRKYFSKSKPTTNSYSDVSSSENDASSDSNPSSSVSQSEFSATSSADPSNSNKEYSSSASSSAGASDSSKEYSSAVSSSANASDSTKEYSSESTSTNVSTDSSQNSSMFQTTVNSFAAPSTKNSIKKQEAANINKTNIPEGQEEPIDIEIQALVKDGHDQPTR